MIFYKCCKIREEPRVALTTVSNNIEVGVLPDPLWGARSLQKPNGTGHISVSRPEIEGTI